MAIRKYTNGAWVPAGRKYGTETDTITNLPVQIIGDGQAIASCQISGNMVQNDTPTPTSPVYPQETGDKTTNLCSVNAWKNTLTTDMRIYFQCGIMLYNGNTNISSKYLNVESVGTFSMTTNVARNAVTRIVIKHNGYSRDLNIADINGNWPAGTIFTLSMNCIGNDPTTLNGVDLQNIMLNLGPTQLPYEPYGYKLPLTVNGTGYPIYLGQVPTARSIKKLVLTGHEDWIYRTGSPPDVYFTEFIGAHFIDNSALCTHYQNQDSGSFDELSDKHVLVRFAEDGSKSFIGFRDSNFPYIADLKSYLAAQYANGTPVTVWYVLATPETAVVNEPLMKIGDYADTVAVTGIPTTGTPENFDVETTLKPSEVSLTYHGWHEHEDTKFMQGE